MTRSAKTGEPVLAIDGLSVAFRNDGRDAPVLHDVRVELRRGEMLGIVGGSGCGKTTTLRAILGHLPRGAVPTAGAVRYDGRDLLRLGHDELRRIRGDEIALIAQGPAAALNPVRSIRRQMRTIAGEHGRRLGDDDLRELMRAVGIGDADRVLHAHPHELSGGMAQRVLIAIALSLEPRVLLADEPTSALDVTVQAQIMELLRRLVRERGLAIALVTHDIALVGDYCDRVVVMADGRVVEQGASADVLYGPESDYARSLVASARPAVTTRPAVAARPQKGASR